jgi:hypothetical protein
MKVPLFSFKKLVALVGASLSLALCLSGCHKSSSQEVERENIAEAVFRYQLDHCHLGNMKQVFFLSLGIDTDPDEAFMKRFVKSGHTVKKFSQSSYEKGLVTDKTTGERGVRLLVTEVELSNNSQAKVKGACYSALGSISDQMYLVARENNEWVVKSAKNILDV